MTPVVKFVQPVGLLDRTRTTKFEQEIRACIAGGADIILIDFKDVSFMDSSGLGTIVAAIKTVQAAGGKLFICSINNQVRMLLELAGLDKIIKIFADRQEFSKAVLSTE